jgi:hypothetical protein
MRGADWYGTKMLTPAGRRKSTTEIRGEAAAAAVASRQKEFDFTKPSKPRDGDGDGRVGAAEVADDKQQAWVERQQFESWLGNLYREQN